MDWGSILIGIGAVLSAILIYWATRKEGMATRRENKELRAGDIRTSAAVEVWDAIEQHFNRLERWQASAEVEIKELKADSRQIHLALAECEAREHRFLALLAQHGIVANGT